MGAGSLAAGLLGRWELSEGGRRDDTDPVTALPATDLHLVGRPRDHGADASGHALFRKRLVRAKLLEFFAAQPPCTVAMEACAGILPRSLLAP